MELLCCTDSHFVICFVMYFISYSWGNKHSLTIISIYLYTLHCGSIATTTADPPMQYNKSVLKSLSVACGNSNRKNKIVNFKWFRSMKKFGLN